MARTAREDSRRTKYPFRICRIAGDSHPHTCAFRSSWSPFIAAFMSPFCFPNLAVLRVESDCGAPFGCTFSLTNRGVIQLSTALSRLEWLSFESPCSQNSCATPQYHASSPYLLVASICGPYGFTLSPQISVIWFLSEDPELRALRELPMRCPLERGLAVAKRGGRRCYNHLGGIHGYLSSVELYNASVLFRFLFYYCYLRSHAAREYIDPVCSVFRSSDLLFL